MHTGRCKSSNEKRLTSCKPMSVCGPYLKGSSLVAMLDYICMACFLAVIITVGGMFARREKTTNAFLLGGSKMPWWAVSVSYLMALLSTVSVVAIPGEAYNNGLRFYISEWIGPIPAIITFFLFVRFYFNVQTFTPFTYLENRFGPSVRATISSIYFFMRISYLAMVLFSCAKVFEGIAGWPIPRTIFLIGIVAFVYATLGGLKAVIWVNVIKFFALCGGLIAAVAVCLQQVDGGAFGVVKYAFAHGHGFNFNSLDSDFFSFDPHVRVTFWLLLISLIGSYMFSNSADQIAIQQLLSTSSYKQARNSFITSILIGIPFGIILWFLGLCMFAYFNQHPMSGGNPGGDVAMFTFIKYKMPSPLPGLVASALLATAISTSGAAMNALATVATKDFYLRFFRAGSSETQQVRFSRAATVVVGILAVLLSVIISLTSRSLGETVLEASSMWIAVMCVIAPTFLVGVLSKRATTVHVMAGIICGWIATLAMIAWYYISKRNGHPISFMAIQVPGLLLTFIFGMVLPFIFGKPAEKIRIDGLTLWTFREKQSIAEQVTKVETL
jgi:SSS family solute:Na+ symporter